MPNHVRFQRILLICFSIALSCSILVSISENCLAGPPVAPTDPLTPEEQKAKFKLPPGFEIQLVAAEPEIQKPMNLAFDAKGRLWVTHSIEYPFAASDPDQSRDGLTILDGIGTDGRATKVTKFADKLNIPIGILPMPNGKEAIVWSIPNIWKLTDTDGDGVADQREILYGPFDFADTHGNQNSFRLGLDGWIYACHGFRNDSKVKRKGAGPVILEMQSGNTYRFRPDGSAIEQMTWGQVNPFGMCVDPRGDFFNADCHSKPVTLLLRGGYYDSFGKPHDGLGFAPLVTSNDHGSTGIAGIVAYASNHFPSEYSGSMFVGNVVTNIVHRDRPQWRGSSPLIETPEDFVVCDDWWFHPVDLQLGPDGALYICDFYNSIIGHYEVDLKHPKRDRHRGRIWRVVYTGESKAGESKKQAPKVPDFSKLSLEELLERLSDANTSIRHFAAFELEIRFGKSGVERARSRLTQMRADTAERRSRLADERVQTLWMQFRSGQLDQSSFQKFATDPEAVVRIHAIKALAEIADWNDSSSKFVRQAVLDPDPFVRRAAAEALGRHPDADHVQPLVQLLKTTSKDDVQLIHATRIALRNQIRQSNAVDRIAEIKLNGEELAAVSEIALAVPNEAAAWFAFEYLRQHEVSESVLQRSLTHVAKYVGAKRLDDVAAFISQKFPNDLKRQMGLFQSIFAGLTQRGTRLSAETNLGKWAANLATASLDSNSSQSASWRNLPLTTASTPSPWGVKHRSSTDGNPDALFFDSISNGEHLTGVLRSAPFVIPQKLTFWMCGHSGLPEMESHGKNLVRLKLVDGDEVVATEKPPRNDVARAYTWDLTRWAGKRGVFEAVDADTATAYAWLAVGRFDPLVVASPVVDYPFTDVTLATAVKVADQLNLKNLSASVLGLITDMSADTNVRMAAAQSGLSLSPDEAMSKLSQVIQDLAEPVLLRTFAAQLLGSINSESSRESLATALRNAPAPLQQPIALSLAGTKEGGEFLFSLIANGKASARLLQDKPILDRLANVPIPDRDQQIAELTQGLPAADDRLKQLIARFSSDFATSSATPEAGMEVFKKSCFACHRLSDQGGKVGPQLDGVGNRGIERLLEDILDPNRNVDAAFRATIVAKTNGLVVTGLKLRQEGTTLILGDNQGKDVAIPADEIEEVRLSNLSPMPSNFADQLNENDLKSLIAFLVKQKTAKAAH